LRYIQKKKKFRIQKSLCAFFGIFLLLPFLANHVPLAMRIKGVYYFPVVRDYTDRDFFGNLFSEPEYQSDRFQKHLKGDDWCLWAPICYSPNFVDETLEKVPAPPSWRHWLGTDVEGKDIFVTLLYAFRQDVFIALSIALLAAVLGCMIGCFQGYVGGWIDFMIQRIFEVWGSIPEIIILLFLFEVRSCTVMSFIVWVSCFHMVRYSNVVRMQVLRVRHSGYVTAARVMGLSSWHIFRHHIVPSTATMVYAQIPFQASSALSVLFALTLLRGSITGSPSIGAMIYQGRLYLCAPWIIIPALVFLMFFVLNVSFYARRLQKRFDTTWGYDG